MKILKEEWTENDAVLILHTEGSDGVQVGPEAFRRRTWHVHDDNGVKVREESGALWTVGEPKGLLRKDALARHAMAHSARQDINDQAIEPVAPPIKEETVVPSEATLKLEAMLEESRTGVRGMPRPVRARRAKA